MATPLSLGAFQDGVNTTHPLLGAANYILDGLYIAPTLLITTAAFGQSSIFIETGAGFPLLQMAVTGGAAAGNNVNISPVMMPFPRGLVVPRGATIQIRGTVASVSAIGYQYGIYGMIVL